MKETESTTARTDTQYKIYTLDQLLAHVADWRRVRQTIVFTNGCFDLLHVGHIVLFEQCRKLEPFMRSPSMWTLNRRLQIPAVG